MKSLAELKERIRVCDYRLNDLQDQRENNAAEGNWSIVKAIKEQESRVRFEKKILESLLEPEDFADLRPTQGRSSSPYHNSDVND